MAEPEDVKRRIVECTAKSIDEICTMWADMFDADTCNGHLRKFEAHVQRFYDDLLKETEEKKAYIEGEILELREEALALQRVLKIDHALPDLPSNTPLTVAQAAIDGSLEEMRTLYNCRRKEITELLFQQEELVEELGETPLELLTDPLATEAELERFRKHLAHLRTVRTERLDRLVDLRTEIKRLMRALEAPVGTNSVDRLLNVREPKLDAATFQQLHNLRDFYQEKVAEQRRKIDATIAKIKQLRERLPESNGSQQQEISFEVDYTHSVLERLNVELARCEMLRRINVKSLIEKLRAEIADYWDKLFYSETQRDRFQHFNNNSYSEDLLLLHEMELEDLKRFYNEHKAIYELFIERKTLWERMNALESKANEPGRYNNRGGQLLKEERERKTIAKKLPSIEEKIKQLVAQYEEREGKAFTINGEDILDCLANDWEEKRREKELLSSARKQIRTPQTASKLNPSSTRTPMSLKNMSKMTSSTTSLRYTPSSQTKFGSVCSGSTGNFKRKLDKSEAVIPNAKRNLLQSLNSPATFLRPNNVFNKPKLPNKSPVKKIRVLASSIQRRSNGRISAARRRSARLAHPNAAADVPNIIVESPSTNDDDIGESAESSEDTYESFEKCIEPSARSSTIVQTRGQRKTRATISKRLAGLPKPCAPAHPSSTVTEQTLVQNKTQTSAGRKLTTKNLPIII